MTARQTPEIVLVTGANGWLGHALLGTLVPGSGSKIRALVVPGECTRVLESHGNRVEIVRGDIRDEKDCERFCSGADGGILYHTAGVIHPRRVRDFYDVNTNGARNLLTAAAAARVRRAVVMSSNSPCGCNPHPDHLFDEESPYRPYLGYGRSKMLMELAVRAAQEAGQLETVIVRAPWFYGPHQPPRQSLFFRLIRTGKGPVVGAGHNKRSMVYIDNLCQGLLLAGTAVAANGQTYWIADERPYAWLEILETITRILEEVSGLTVSRRRLRIPAPIGRLAYAVDRTLQALGWYGEKIHVLGEIGRTIACSIAKARKELGYEPRVGLEEGMRRSIRWCLEAGYAL